MADFVTNTIVKSAVRHLANPIADVDVFNNIIQAVITNNPFGSIPYMLDSTVHQPVERTRESYTARFVYEDTNAKRVGSTSESYSTLAGYNAGIAAVLANTANSVAHAGTIGRNADADSFTVTLRLHDPNGELYFVNFSRQQVTISSFMDDAIKNKIDLWADSVNALA